MNRRQIAKQIGIIVGGMLFVYLASYGPVVAYLVRKGETTDNPGFGTTEANTVYSPIVLIREKSGTAFNALLDYSEFCYRVRYGKHPGRHDTLNIRR